VSRKHSQNALISVNCEYVDDAKRKGNLVNIFFSNTLFFIVETERKFMVAYLVLWILLFKFKQRL